MGSELILVFPSFSDDESILAVPVGSTREGTSIPFLIEDQLMYILYSDLFRVQKNKVRSCIGVMDSNAMDVLIEGVSSALRGDVLDVAMPSAIIKRPIRRGRDSSPVSQSVGAHELQPLGNLCDSSEEQDEAEDFSAHVVQAEVCVPEGEAEYVAETDACADSTQKKDNATGGVVEDVGVGRELRTDTTTGADTGTGAGTEVSTGTGAGAGTTADAGIGTRVDAGIGTGAVVGLGASAGVGVDASDKVKYTYNDYIFIMNTSPDDIDVVLRKYDIKDRRALNRVKYNLKKKFGRSAETTQAGAVAAASVSRVGGEVGGERQLQRGV